MVYEWPPMHFISSLTRMTKLNVYLKRIKLFSNNFGVYPWYFQEKTIADSLLGRQQNIKNAKYNILVYVFDKNVSIIYELLKCNVLLKKLFEKNYMKY